MGMLSKNKKPAAEKPTKKEEHDNTLRGVLFQNDKGNNPKRPDFKGNFTDADGNEFWVSAWEKESKDGDPFISFTMQPKEE